MVIKTGKCISDKTAYYRDPLGYVKSASITLCLFYFTLYNLQEKHYVFCWSEKHPDYFGS